MTCELTLHRAVGCYKYIPAAGVAKAVNSMTWHAGREMILTVGSKCMISHVWLPLWVFNAISLITRHAGKHSNTMDVDLYASVNVHGLNVSFTH